MITIPETKKLIDKVIIDALEAFTKHLTIAHLGLKAKQSDVTKVRALVQKRIDKINKVPEPSTGGIDEVVKV